MSLCSRQAKVLRTVALSISLVVGFSTIAYAGSLTPTSVPAAVFYTLDDIYTRLTTNATAIEGSHAFVPSGAPAATLHTIKQLYQAIPTINTVKVLSGTTYLGVAGTALGDSSGAYVLGTAAVRGTALKNMFNGTTSSFTGASLANGGADDYNGGGSPATGRYTGHWTTCIAGNSYCGTGLASAATRDDTTGLVWSLPCAGSGCSAFTGIPSIVYSWNNSYRNNNSLTAAQLCSAGVHGQSGWYLPHQKQFMQAYIDGSYGNIDAAGIYRYYWSATSNTNTSGAWAHNLSHGYTDGYVTKGSANYIRCIRLAP